MEDKNINYAERVVKQTDLVNKLADDQKKAPSDEKKYKLQQETDILRHYSNAVKDNPKDRSKNAYKTASHAVLNSVIELPPEE